MGEVHFERDMEHPVYNFLDTGPAKFSKVVKTVRIVQYNVKNLNITVLSYLGISESKKKISFQKQSEYFIYTSSDFQ